MRCCECGGELTVTEQTVVGASDEIEDDDDEFEDVPNVRLLSFGPAARTPREALRRN
jgi:hypothetical protein